MITILKHLFKAFKKNRKYGSLLMLCLFLFEGFLFVPLDLVLAVYAHKNKKHAIAVAFICAFLSSISGLMSYSIGLFAYKSIGVFILSGQWMKSLFEKLLVLYSNYGFLVVFVGTLVPVPTKVVTISAGFFGINLFKFFFSILSARIIRFVCIAYWSMKHGHKVDKLINKFWFFKK